MFVRRVVLSLSLFLPLPVAAATLTWSGTHGALWSDSANWGGTTPAAGDDLLFPAGAITTAVNNDLPAGTQFHSIVISGNSYAISGNAIALTTGLTSSGSNVTLALPSTLAGNQTWSVTSGGLTTSGSIALGGFALTLNANGGDGLHGVISGDATTTGAISGNGSLTKSGSGDWTLAGANTFSGLLSVNAGRLIAVSDSALGVSDNMEANATKIASGATLTLDEIALGNELIHLAAPGSPAGSEGLQVLGSSSFNGTLAAGSGAVIDLAGNLTLNGLIIADPPGSQTSTLTLANDGALTLTNPSFNYTGSISFGPGANRLSLATSVVKLCRALSFAPSGTLRLNGHAVTVLDVTGSGGTIDLGSGGSIVTTDAGAGTESGSSWNDAAIIGSGNATVGGPATDWAGSFAFSGTLTDNATSFGLHGSGTAAFVMSGGSAHIDAASLGTLTQVGGSLFMYGEGTDTRGVTLGANTHYGQSLMTTLHVTGTVNLGGAILALDTPSQGQGVIPDTTYVLIGNDGSDPVNGTFAGLAEGALIKSQDSFNYYIHYSGGDGNDVVVATKVTARLSSATTLVSSANPSGTNVTFTASVLQPAATGTVTFFDSSTPLATLPLADGISVLSTTLTPGIHSMTAAYSGDANYLPGTSGILQQTVSDTSVRVVSFTVLPGSIPVGGTALLQWDVANGTSVSIDNDIGAQPLNGSAFVSPPATTTYHLTAADDSSTVTAQVTLTVGTAAPPAITFTSSAYSLISGQTATLSWTVAGATNVQIDNGVGTQPFSGTLVVRPFANTTYTLSALGPGGTASSHVTIVVNPSKHRAVQH